MFVEHQESGSFKLKLQFFLQSSLQLPENSKPSLSYQTPTPPIWGLHHGFLGINTLTTSLNRCRFTLVFQKIVVKIMKTCFPVVSSNVEFHNTINTSPPCLARSKSRGGDSCFQSCFHFQLINFLISIKSLELASF